MSKKNIFIWCCDLNKNKGEGIIANKFLKDLKLFNKNLNFIINSPKKTNKSIFFERFVYPYMGVIYLWKIYFTKKNSEICYVNYLPLWNFLLFFFLPPKTIIGPITGGSLFNRKSLINYLLRNYVLNLFNFISYLIIKIRIKKLLFSTDLLKKIFNNNYNYYYNYVLKDLNIKNIKSKKKYDLIFYLNDHKNKNIDLQISLAKSLSSKFKIITVGKKIKKPNIKNFGYISRDKLLLILKSTKYAFLSPENLYSFFAIDCISSNTNIFFKKYDNYRPYNFRGVNLLDYENFNKLVSQVEKQLSIKFKFQVKIVKSQKNFKNYFKL